MLTGTPIFGMVLEREPPSLANFFPYLNTWVQDAGGFAAVGLIVLTLTHAILTLVNAGKAKSAYKSPWYLGVLGILSGVALVGFFIGGVLFFLNPVPPYDPAAGPPPLSALQTVAYAFYTIAGLAGLIGFSLPLAVDLPRLRFRRIYALARLSVIESVRSRLLWAFMLFLLVFLFPPKWFFPLKAEHEVRASVTVVYWVMTPMLLLAGSLLAAFALPTDIKNQTIHTVTTKPVERFEVVLGRFFGYVALATMVLLGLSLVSLLFLRATRVSPEAAAETFKARVPIYGALSFRDLRKPNEQFQGENVGREWEYRKYVAGGNPNPFRAVWAFGDADLRTPLFSQSLGSQAAVPLEFGFDIFRTTKGKQEGEGVTCSFTVVSWQYGTDFSQYTPRVGLPTEAKEGVKPADPAKAEEYRKAVQGKQSDFAALDKLAEQYGIFQATNIPVSDYHTGTVLIPPGLIRNAQAGTPPAKEIDGRKVEAPRLLVLVQCDTPTQFLGVARRDLYLLASEGWFDWNFIKGTAGLWLRLCLVIGVAVVLSTYLSGAVSWLVAMSLFLMGRAQEFIVEVAKGNQANGGGPFQSAYRLVNGETPTAPLDDTAGGKIAAAIDPVFEFGLRRVLNFIPDVNSYDWTPYVESGFNIDPGDLFLTTLFLVGYLLPWGVLGYHLIKSREIAG